MQNSLKWSDTFYKSCSKCCKIFKETLTTLGCYALWKGLMAFCSIVNSPIITQFVNVFFRERITVLAFASEAIRVKPSLARFKMLINCCYQYSSCLMKHLLKTNIINNWISALICSDLAIKSLIFSLVTFAHCCLNQLGNYNDSLFLGLQNPIQVINDWPFKTALSEWFIQIALLERWYLF